MSLGVVHANAVAEALVDLTGGQEDAVLHLVRCDRCRDRVLAATRDRDLEDTVDESPQEEEDLLAQGIAALLRAETLRESRERLDEIRKGAREGKDRQELIASSGEDLLEMALALAQEADDLPSLEELSGLVSDLLQQRPPKRAAEQAIVQARLAILRGRASRIAGDWAQANRWHLGASRLLAGVPWQTVAGAELARSWGILKWESGELDLAEASLRHAARVYGDIGPPDEEAEARVCLGMLLNEREQPESALKLIALGRSALSRRRPGLSLWARYEHAHAAAQLGLTEEARGLLVEVRPEESELATEALYQWLRGRVVAEVGHDQAAAERDLEGARVRLLAEGNYGYAALCSLDLVDYLLDLGRREEASAVVVDLLKRFEDEAKAGGLAERAQEALAPRSCRLTQQQRADGVAKRRRLLRKRHHSVLPPSSL